MSEQLPSNPFAEQQPTNEQPQVQQRPQTQQTQQTQQQHYAQVPVEAVTLPSKGAIYPLGHPLCNEEAVEIRCMSRKGRRRPLVEGFN